MSLDNLIEAHKNARNHHNLVKAGTQESDDAFEALIEIEGKIVEYLPTSIAESSHKATYLLNDICRFGTLLEYPQDENLAEADTESAAHILAVKDLEKAATMIAAIYRKTLEVSTFYKLVEQAFQKSKVSDEFNTVEAMRNDLNELKEMFGWMPSFKINGTPYFRVGQPRPI
jgi:hypothetical protein